MLTSYNATCEKDHGGPPNTMAFLKGVVENGSTPGNLVVRWSQLNNRSNPVTVHRGSYLKAFRLP